VDELLTVEDLHFSYGERRAVDGLSLELRPGEILGLLGPNGAGKSTLMALLCGLLVPADGRIRVLGGDPRDPRIRASLGLAPQELALYEELSARENLHFFGRIQGLTGKRLTERSAAVLEETGLTSRAKERVGSFSGGMKRRLNLAVALLHEPRLLLLDEATAGVDPQSRLALFELVERQRAAGRGVLYATHYMEEAQRLCDRVAIVDHGRLLALDTVPALLASHSGASLLEAVRGSETLRVETRDPLADLARLQAAGPLDSFTLRQPDLEQVFLRLTGRHLRD
jgi:ABC-2 type transport system ATP-binding protein